MRTSDGRTLAWLLLPPALFLLLAAAPIAAQAAAGNAHVVGVVVDRETDAPLGTVQVVLETAEGQEVWSGVTDTRGRFRISRISPGVYDISFSRLAYGTATERVTVASEAEVEMRAQLATEAIELEPVVVTSSRRSALQTVGFFDRERYFDGDFFLREDIEDRNPLSVPDLVRGLPAFLVTGTTNPIIVGRDGPAYPGRGPCPPAVFLDGMPIEYDPYAGRMADDNEMDQLQNPFDLVNPDQLAAMEVYSSTSAPAQFYTRGACGAIVMWTLQGNLTPGEAAPTRSPMRRFLIAGAIVAGIHLIL